MLPSFNTNESGDGCYVDSDPVGLAEIYRPSVNLAVWQRQLNNNVSHYVQELTKNSSVSDIRSVVRLHEVKDDILSRLPLYTGQMAFADDVYLLTEMFTDLFNLEWVGLRLTLLEKAMCPRFHTDNLPCRLISTYIGRATEWLPNNTVDRSKLGHNSSGLSDKVSGIYRHADLIQQLNVGDVDLMKGAGWAGFENEAVVHRSPDIATGEKRLILTLDFAH